MPARIAALHLTSAATAVPCRLAARRPLVAAPAARAGTRSAAAAANASSSGSGSSGGGYQQPLTNQERKAKRAESQRLGKQLCTVNLGQKGLTPAFIEGFRLALAANELVKVKVGACDEGQDEIVEALSAAGDCVLVHKIGFTLTFYRDCSLPPAPPYRPRRRAAVAAVAGGGGAQAGAEEEEEEEEEEIIYEVDEELAAYLLENEDAFSDSDSEGEEEDAGPPNSSRRQAAAARAARANRPPPPPEFTVIG